MEKQRLTAGDQCTGCKICQTECSLHLTNEINPKNSAINIIENFSEAVLYRLEVCTQCGICAEVCPENCIEADGRGVYVIDRDKCTGCQKCIEACPFNVMVVDQRGKALKCDLCQKCIEKCPVNNLKLKG